MSAEQYAWNELQRCRDRLEAVRRIIEAERTDDTNPWELLHAIDLATSAESESQGAIE